MNGILKIDNRLLVMPVNGRQQCTTLGCRFLPSSGLDIKYKALGTASVLLNPCIQFRLLYLCDFSISNM